WAAVCQPLKKYYLFTIGDVYPQGDASGRITGQIQQFYHLFIARTLDRCSFGFACSATDGFDLGSGRAVDYESYGVDAAVVGYRQLYPGACSRRVDAGADGDLRFRDKRYRDNFVDHCWCRSAQTNLC